MKKFIKSQPVLAIAFLAALVTVFFVRPDRQYGGYINLTVLIELFSLMVAVGGLRSIGIFDNVTAALLKNAGNIRRLGIILTLMCYFSSMLVTNDVALLTFVPLTLLIYGSINDEKSRVLTIVLETCAANAGSMITPVGNPQNLYIYDNYAMNAGEFFRAMIPAGAVSLVLILIAAMMLPKTECSAEKTEKKAVPKVPAALYAVLFGICLLTVLRIIPDWACFIAAVVFALILNRRLLIEVDYALLATFVCFFVFVGNIARIEAVSSFLSSVLSGKELVITAVLSQVISNVPAAVMLSGFTENSIQLMLGADIGGFGTIIASLASLISFQFYRKAENAKTMRYLAVFSAINFAMLVLLTAFALLI